MLDALQNYSTRFTIIIVIRFVGTHARTHARICSPSSSWSWSSSPLSSFSPSPSWWSCWCPVRVGATQTASHQSHRSPSEDRPMAGDVICFRNFCNWWRWRLREELWLKLKICFRKYFFKLVTLETLRLLVKIFFQLCSASLAICSQNTHSTYNCEPRG